MHEIGGGLGEDLDEVLHAVSPPAALILSYGELSDLGRV